MEIELTRLEKLTQNYEHSQTDRPPLIYSHKSFRKRLHFSKFTQNSLPRPRILNAKMMFILNIQNYAAQIDCTPICVYLSKALMFHAFGTTKQKTNQIDVTKKKKKLEYCESRGRQSENIIEHKSAQTIEEKKNFHQINVSFLYTITHYHLII